MGQSSSRRLEVNGYHCEIGPRLSLGDTIWGRDEGLAVFALLPVGETSGFLSNSKPPVTISKLSTGGFALRRADKSSVLQDRHKLRHVLAERKALAEFAHEAPFVDHLFKSFQTEFELLLVTELLDGGSLRNHLSSSKEGRFDEEKARFYAAQLLTALTHVHQAKFAHRDVRLDNLVLNSKGHCTLINFTLAIRVGALTSSSSSSYHLLSVGQHSSSPGLHLSLNHSNISLHSSSSSLSSNPTPPPSLTSSSATVSSSSSHPPSPLSASGSVEVNEAVHGMSSALLEKKQQQHEGLPVQKASGETRKKKKKHQHDHHHEGRDCMCHSSLYASFARNELVALEGSSELALKLKPPKRRTTGRTSPSGPLSEFTASSHPYMAPELFRREFHDQTVDWWSFGVCLFEMLTGKLPFPANHSTHDLDFTPFSDVLSPDAQDLLSKLLNPKMDERLRSGDEIREHPFFSSVDWQAFLQRKVKSPFIPSPSKLISDPAFYSQALKPNEDTRISESDQLLFKHWDWDLTDSSSKQRRILSQTDIWHLYQVFSDPTKGIREAERQFLFRTYAKCWVGADAVDWILEHVAEHIDGISGIQRSEALSILNYWWRKHLIKGVNEKQEQVEDADLFYVFTDTQVTPGEAEDKSDSEQKVKPEGKPEGELKDGEQLVVEPPVSEQPVAEQLPAVEQLVTEQSVAEQLPAVEQPVTEQSVAEQLVAEVATEPEGSKEVEATK